MLNTATIAKLNAVCVHTAHWLTDYQCMQIVNNCRRSVVLTQMHGIRCSKNGCSKNRPEIFQIFWKCENVHTPSYCLITELVGDRQGVYILNWFVYFSCMAADFVRFTMSVEHWRASLQFDCWCLSSMSFSIVLWVRVFVSFYFIPLASGTVILSHKLFQQFT